MMLVQAIAELFKYKMVGSIIVLACWSSHDNTSQGNLANITDLVYNINDVYIHPNVSISLHPWAVWTIRGGLQVLFERNRILRRQNLEHYPIRIATPMGLYSDGRYNGTFKEYLLDMTMAHRDIGVRTGYISSTLMIQWLNASDVLVPTMLWGTEVNNSSMMLMLRYGSSDLGGGALRMMPERFRKLDYTMPIWPFNVGFTYLAERESSSNMFLKPFTINVWWCTLSLFIVLALAQRITAKQPMEKEGAYIAALATYLQQDASAVPEGVSGRWSFLVLSISAMLIHAYYTSAIVSALMSAGRGGPDSLRALGDSKYAIASEDYDYIRYLMFDVQTKWDDLEYLKKKKLTSRFYQEIYTGVRMLQGGQTAFHTEYNQLFPHLRSFTDEQICKLQYIDTIPEVLTWVTATKNGQWTSTFRIAGAWLHETGLAKCWVTRLRLKPPPCRAALLAERVNIDDVAPVLILTLAGAVASLMLLGIEILIAKWKWRMTSV
ncbi:uncharacterized protein LOC123870639 [Maniola jurtina]|uniref:uncharacterized protein LOC123870639 n=1 Tax=Maniola jurtina TaxID=191418 RepID=UPI001E6864B3|nr:uncharacterized protein LOC123870639 [Maniola jurtina]